MAGLCCASFATASFAASEKSSAPAANKIDVVVKKSEGDALEVYPAYEEKNKAAADKNAQATTEKKLAPAETSDSTSGDSALGDVPPIEAPVPIPDETAKIVEPSQIDKSLDRFQQQKQEFDKRARGGD